MLACSILKEVFWVLVKGPELNDAKFLGEWLLSAARADDLLQQQKSSDEEFVKQIQYAEPMYKLEFSPAAMAFSAMYLRNLTPFELSLVQSEWADMFAIMAQLGFFSQVGDCQRMTLPIALNGARIRKACLQLVSTWEDDSGLHPEWLVNCRSHREVMQNKVRLAISHLTVMEAARQGNCRCSPAK